MRRHHSITAAAALCVSAIALSACTSDSEPAADSTASSTSSAASSSATTSAASNSAAPADFDLQAHRGGRGAVIENSLPAFSYALELGVSTLELDVVISKDGVPIVWHDPSIQPEKCLDTEPATADDPAFPYVGKLVHDLTLEQLQTLDCGSQTLKDYPEQRAVPGQRLATLPEVFELVATYDAPAITYNIETKIEAESPVDSAEPQVFVDAITKAASAAGVTDRISIQSFDWSSLILVKEQHPDIPTVALYDETTVVETPDTASPWLGGVRLDKFDGDVAKAAQSIGAAILSPAFKLITDAAYVENAHALGLKLIPWTVNEEADLKRILATGVDGIITDYPARLRTLLEAENVAVPAPATKQ